VAHEEFSASTYSLLGSISTWSDVDPAALQAWHLTGSEFGIAIGQVVLLLGVAAAGLSSRSVPSWVGWTALALAALHETPFGFLGSMLFLLWAAAVGIVFTLRPGAIPVIEPEPAALQHR
jgi:hypothetical protein